MSELIFPTFESVLESAEKYKVLVTEEPNIIMFTKAPDDIAAAAAEENEVDITWHAIMVQKTDDLWKISVKCHQKGVSPITLPVFSAANKNMAADLCLALVAKGQYSATYRNLSIQPFPSGPLGKSTPSAVKEVKVNPLDTFLAKSYGERQEIATIMRGAKKLLALTKKPFIGYDSQQNRTPQRWTK